MRVWLAVLVLLYFAVSFALMATISYTAFYARGGLLVAAAFVLLGSGLEHSVLPSLAGIIVVAAFLAGALVGRHYQRKQPRQDE